MALGLAATQAQEALNYPVDAGNARTRRAAVGYTNGIPNAASS
jgi:hypothetical protein